MGLGASGQDSGQLSPGGPASPRGQQLRDHLAKITHQKIMKQRQNQGLNDSFGELGHQEWKYLG